MLGKTEALTVLKKALKYSSAKQTEAILMNEDSHLTRFANSVIHQNVSERNASLSVRVITDKKIGSASTNSLTEEAIHKVVDKAIAIARLQKENQDFISLPRPEALPEVRAYFPATAGCTPEMRAEGVGEIVKLAKAKNLLTFGAYSTGAVELAIASSEGVEAYAPFTDVSLNIIMRKDEDTGYGNGVSRDLAKLDIQSIAKEAIEKCLLNKNPIELAPGEYETILEEHAVSDFLLFLGHLGLGALSVQEGRSFMKGKFGQKIMGENISIWDDGLDDRGFSVPFDFEGLPKQKLMLIEQGIARNVVYDSYTAGKEGKLSTGHSLPNPNLHGPLPMNLFLGGGASSKEEMLASTKKGILVTRFHYTNVVEPMQAVITGMTRDGTYLVEDGKITKAVKNLRFTESILKALSQVSALSRETKLASEGTVYNRRFATGSVVPVLKIDKFNFSGVTEF